MIKVSVNSIILVLISVIIVSGTALSATIPDNKESAYTLDTSNAQNQLKYHVVTLPSTNRKRVNAMSIKFLSLIPKAMLIPKTSEHTVYRLVANTFDSFELAKKRKAELLQQCESPFIVKSNDGYSVIASSQLTETLAGAEHKRLAGKNIPTTIVELKLPLKQWQMRSTESFDIRVAVSMASKLAKIGVTTTIVPADD
jgi:hypothetical protein